MNKNYNPKLKPYSQKLRREMTKEERKLWYDFLKKLNITVKRQKIIGNYILDFYISAAKIAIELDGSQHYEKDYKEKDRFRDENLRLKGIKVLRYSNADINRYFEAVCSDIIKNIEDTSSVGLWPPASPQGEAYTKPAK